MKYIPILLCFAFVWIAACSSAAPLTVQNSNAAANSERSQNTIAHGPAEKPAPMSNTNSPGKWSASGDPIDTTKFDKAIADAERAQKAKPADAAAKTTLAQAYFERGFALTEARQYASALGDYRKALKLDPNHAESKQWMDQIISIYSMLKKEAPKEGEEPPPLPMQKPARQ
jgi:tetratricopeptide (TPR) repeat protein